MSIDLMRWKMDLPGLQRLMSVCSRLGLRLEMDPPARTPPAAGALVVGHRLDPVLAAVYSRMGGGYFANDLYLLRAADHRNQLEEQNRWWREGWQKRLAMPVFVFGGVASLAYYYATVPRLADAQGCQPVVKVDTYEEPHALPIASNVDRLFDTYSHFLEELVASPGYEEEGISALVFPWDVPHILARDERLAELMRAGSFGDLMSKEPSAQQWAEQVMNPAPRA